MYPTLAVGPQGLALSYYASDPTDTQIRRMVVGAPFLSSPLSTTAATPVTPFAPVPTEGLLSWHGDYDAIVAVPAGVFPTHPRASFALAYSDSSRDGLPIEPEIAVTYVSFNVP